MRIAILVQDILQANTLRAVLDRKNLDQSVLAYHVGRRKDAHLRALRGLQTAVADTV
jgi:hypothetical protein